MIVLRRSSMVYVYGSNPAIFSASPFSPRLVSSQYEKSLVPFSSLSLDSTEFAEVQ
jgi:hypothetical protein